jgi:hypothetical protein
MTSSIRINIVTEGQTEETFVNDILIDHLIKFGIYDIRAHCITTGYSNGRPKRGGLLSYPHLKKDVNTWLRSDPSAIVTTMIDLYGIPENFPGKSQWSIIKDPLKKILQAESEFSQDINNKRFVPYIQLHEFEGILFSDIQKIHESMIDTKDKGTNLKALKTIRSSFKTPEEINDNFNTAPSKRILRIYPSYQKPTDGIIIAKRIGIDKIRKECPHFDMWLSRLEALPYVPILQ